MAAVVNPNDRNRTRLLARVTKNALSFRYGIQDFDDCWWDKTISLPPTAPSFISLASGDPQAVFMKQPLAAC
jgi:hypothetical protein